MLSERPVVLDLKGFRYKKNAFVVEELAITTSEYSDRLSIMSADPCEDTYNDKEFVRLATAGRHRGIDVKNVKHKLFQQSRWSRTSGLNTSHISLFESTRDVQQLDLLGRQLNISTFLRSCYELATRDSFGHLLINLIPVHQIV